MFDSILNMEQLSSDSSLASELLQKKVLDIASTWKIGNSILGGEMPERQAVPFRTFTIN